LVSRIFDNASTDPAQLHYDASDASLLLPLNPLAEGSFPMSGSDVITNFTSVVGDASYW